MKNNVEEIFEELKSKEFIGKNIKLIRDKNVPNFMAIGTNIKYNPRYVSMKTDGLRFTLLHEVGHIQESTIKIILFSILIFILYLFMSVIFYIIAIFCFLYFFSIKLPPYTLILFIIPFIILFLYKFLRPLKKRREFEADAWAAKQIISPKGFRTKPSLMAKQAFGEVIKIEPKFNVFIYFVSIVDKVLPYPRSIERIQKLEESEKVI